MTGSHNRNRVQGSGERDLGLMLAALTVSRRPGEYHLASLGAEDAAGLTLGSGVEALISEPESDRDTVTVVADRDAADRLGLTTAFIAAWLTLDVHSSLEAVGLTAAVSRTLADGEIACNVLAGFHHDHLLVPIDRVDEAIECLE